MLNLDDNLINKKCFVVGENTKRVATSLGYEVLGFASNQENLLKLIKSNKPSENMVHIRGKHTVGNLCDSLKRSAVRQQKGFYTAIMMTRHYQLGQGGH